MGWEECKVGVEREMSGGRLPAHAQSAAYLDAVAAAAPSSGQCATGLPSEGGADGAGLHVSARGEGRIGLGDGEDGDDGRKSSSGRGHHAGAGWGWEEEKRWWRGRGGKAKGETGAQTNRIPSPDSLPLRARLASIFNLHHRYTCSRILFP